jgi:hypothetical protein
MIIKSVNEKQTFMSNRNLILEKFVNSKHFSIEYQKFKSSLGY